MGDRRDRPHSLTLFFCQSGREALEPLRRATRLIASANATKAAWPPGRRSAPAARQAHPPESSPLGPCPDGPAAPSGRASGPASKVNAAASPSARPSSAPASAGALDPEVPVPPSATTTAALVAHGSMPVASDAHPPHVPASPPRAFFTRVPDASTAKTSTAPSGRTQPSGSEATTCVPSGVQPTHVLALPPHDACTTCPDGVRANRSARAPAPPLEGATSADTSPATSVAVSRAANAVQPPL